jgi:alpha-mannosidase
LPSGESFIRQLLFGQRYFQEHFGKECEEFWMPDTFGYSPQLPQILRGANVRFFLSQKMSWNLTNTFPLNTFHWEGLDGSSVLAHFPPADNYNSKANVEEVLKSSTNNKDRERFNSSMLLFGEGDGGGGPNADNLEQLRRLKNVDGAPKVQLASPPAFFKALEERSLERPPAKWVGELYLELHNGTYTSQADTKTYNRRCEELLHDAEFFAALCHCRSHTVTSKKRKVAQTIAQPPPDFSYDYPHEEVRACWEVLLLNHFHDVIPGSSIGQVYKDASRLYAQLQKTGRGVVQAALTFLQQCETWDASSGGNDGGTSTRDYYMSFEAAAPQGPIPEIARTIFEEPEVVQGPPTCTSTKGIPVIPLPGETCSCVLVWNSLGFPRENELAIVPVAVANDLFGRKQVLACGERALVEVTVPAMGFASYSLKSCSAPTQAIRKQQAHAAFITANTANNPCFILQNDMVRVEIGARSGQITSLLDSRVNPPREAIKFAVGAKEGKGNCMKLFEDIPLFWDAWDCMSYHLQKGEEIGAGALEVCKVELGETGPLRVSVIVTWASIGKKSTLSQIIKLSCDSPLVEFETSCEWHEDHVFLKAEFPLNVRSHVATYECQFGCLQRPTHANTTWDMAKYEVCGHRWACIEEPGFGVAIITDSKYGYGCRDGTFRLSLLRSPKQPDKNCDMGKHHFRYAIMPFLKIPAEERLAEIAASFNSALYFQHCSPATTALAVAKSYFWVQNITSGLGVIISHIKVCEAPMTVGVEGCQTSGPLPTSCVVRLYEPYGGRGSVKLCCVVPLKSVATCNFLEQDIDCCEIESGAHNTNYSVLLAFKPFEIVSVKLTFAQ